MKRPARAALGAALALASLLAASPAPAQELEPRASKLRDAFLVGYEMGASEARSWPHVVILAALLSFTLYVILNFEYPRLGLIRVDDFDTLIVQVRASMG
jgi:hypothetical protein